MWAFRAIPGVGVYWSLTICRTRGDGQRDRRSSPWPCGLWTPAGAQGALNAPDWHLGSVKWPAGARDAIRAGLNFIALGVKEE